jgi:hypothetical protein
MNISHNKNVSVNGMMKKQQYKQNNKAKRSENMNP